MTEECWVGPANIIIPLSVKTVPSIDKCNRTTFTILDGEVHVFSTEMLSDAVPYTVDEYRNKFAEKKSDGKWYWKMV